MINKYGALSPEATFHIYNRANGCEKLFLSAENYRYFIQKYQEHISPVADTFCYCLMPNHFHFLVRIKTEDQLRAAFPKLETLEKLPSKSFSNLFSAYTQAFNKQQGRMGSLFMKNFKRKIISDKNYLHKLVHYIHLNPVEARLCSDPHDWNFSSYKILLNEDFTFLKRDETISWFEDKTNFIQFHQSRTLPVETRVNP